MGEEQQPQTSAESKLLIELIFKNPKSFFGKAKYWIQNKPYKFGLKIKNIDEKNSSECTIINLALLPGEGGNITQNITEQFSVSTLNPGQEIDLWWPDPLAAVIKGSSWIQCDVIAKDQANIIRTYQSDKHSTKPQIYKLPNQWGDALLIRGEMEEEQRKTNFLLLVLTILMFLQGVWGLDKIVKIILDIVGSLFYFIGSLLLKLG